MIPVCISAVNFCRTFDFFFITDYKLLTFIRSLLCSNHTYIFFIFRFSTYMTKLCKHARNVVDQYIYFIFILSKIKSIQLAPRVNTQIRKLPLLTVLLLHFHSVFFLHNMSQRFLKLQMNGNRNEISNNSRANYQNKNENFRLT